MFRIKEELRRTNRVANCTNERTLSGHHGESDDSVYLSTSVTHQCEILKPRSSGEVQLEGLLQPLEHPTGASRQSWTWGKGGGGYSLGISVLHREQAFERYSTYTVARPSFEREVARGDASNDRAQAWQDSQLRGTRVVSTIHLADPRKDSQIRPPPPRPSSRLVASPSSPPPTVIS